MANLTPMSPTYWSRVMGRKLYKTTVFRSLASFEEQPVLKDGQIVDRPYRSDVVAETYTKGTALTAQDLTATSDQLTVNQFKGLLMYIDQVDKVQNKWSAAKLWAEEAAKRIGIIIDANFFYEYVNANDTIDDGDLGGTAGNGFTLSTANVDNVFAKLNRKLDVNNVERSERFLALSPQFYDVLWQRISGKESLLGDKTSENGNIGRYAGVELFLTNNLTGSAQWVPANAPSNGDTITINGITFQWVTNVTPSSAAGDVQLEGTVAASIDNLVAFINAGGVGNDTEYKSLSTANQRTVQNWVAVDGTTYIEVRAKGASYMTVTGSDATDVWTAARQIQHCLGGRKGAIDMVIQQEPDVEMASTVSAGKRGMNIMPLSIFGIKTFNQGKNEIFDVQVRSDAF